MSRQKVEVSTDSSKEAVGNRIKTLRQRLGLSQQKLVDFLGVGSRSFISEVEAGKSAISIDLVAALSTHGYSADYILTGKLDDGQHIDGDINAPHEQSEPSSILIQPPISAFDELGPDGRPRPPRSLKNSVVERLKHLAETWDIPDVQRLLLNSGIGEDELRQVMATDSISPETAEKAASALGIRAEWLATGKGPMVAQGADIEGQRGYGEEEASATADQAKGDEKGKKIGEFVQVPKAKSNLSAGGGIIPEETLRQERYAFRRDWLRSVARTTNSVILFDVEGDSMLPTLADGDTVLIDMQRTEIRSGGIFALAVGGVVQIKRLQWVANNRIRVLSDNPQYHTYETDPNDLRIIGKAIWVGRPLG